MPDPGYCVKAMALSQKKRDEHRAYMRSRYQSDPAHRAKQKARTATRKAVMSGKLVKGCCEKCNPESAQAHHDDYPLPLAVRRLCLRCHEAVHGGPGFHG